MSGRGTKFYRKNENEVMESLGLCPTVNSGAGWIQKEDGENETFLCQLKSTDKQSISIKNMDLRQLELNAVISHKIPVFAIQFFESGDIWLMLRPCDLEEFSLSKKNENFIDSMLEEQKIEEKEQKQVDKTYTKSYNNNIARNKYWKEREEEQKQIERERKAWKRNYRKKG